MGDSRGRDFSIDILRCVGALAVICAHVDPPAWLFQLRNFGTPMLIMVSALSAAVVYRQRRLDAWSFFKRRLVKLTLPAWVFLSIFFGLALAYSSLRHNPFPFSATDVLDSYEFGAGIGYVWIFRVYLIIALLTPFMLTLHARVPDKNVYFVGLLLAYVVYDLAAQRIAAHAGGTFVQPLTQTVMTVVPYALLFAYGLGIDALGTFAVAMMSLASLLIFVVMAIAKFRATGAFVPTQDYKYPPTLYYLSFAMFWMNGLYLLARSQLARRLPAGPLTWLSCNLLWVYLWHIMALFVWDVTIGTQPSGRLTFAVAKLLFVLSLAVTLTLLQQRLLARAAPVARPHAALLWTIFG